MDPASRSGGSRGKRNVWDSVEGETSAARCSLRAFSTVAPLPAFRLSLNATGAAGFYYGIGCLSGSFVLMPGRLLIGHRSAFF